MTRQEKALGEPPARLTGFPRWPLERSRMVYRAHTAGRGPWWFASAHGTDDDGRFDLADPHGTCYLAATINGAVRERWGTHLATLQTVTAAMADTTTVSALHTPRGSRLADTLSAKAAQYGVTRELGTATPYALTQRWAAAFHQLGTGGIRYLPRFSTGPRDHAYAVFGDAGARSWAADSTPLSGRDAARHSDIRVISPPLRVRIATPPVRR